MKLEYNCKFCRRPGFVVIGDTPIEHEAAERWFPMLCCDRCGIFREKIRKVRMAIRGLALKFSNPEGRTPVEIIQKSSEAITEATKKVTTLVCDYYRVQNIWSRDFPQQIFDNPARADLVIKNYIQGVSEIAKKTSA